MQRGKKGKKKQFMGIYGTIEYQVTGWVLQRLEDERNKCNDAWTAWDGEV